MVVLRRPFRHAGLVVRRQEVDQPAHLQQTLDVVVEGAVGDARLGGVHRGAAQFLGGDHLVGDGLHHIGAGDEHVARVAHHEDEIGHRRRIDVAAGARAHDDADLRDDAGREHVALEHLAVAAERGDALLDARAAGIEQADDRARAFIAMSWILMIFCAWVSDSEPPNTVKSLANRYTVRPLTVPQPVTTPSPGIFASPCRIRSSGARRTCRTPRTSPCPAGVRCARARSACRACAAPRCAPCRRPARASARRSSSLSRMSFMQPLPVPARSEYEQKPYHGGRFAVVPGERA